MARKGSLEERMTEFFRAHPKDSYNAEALIRIFTDKSEGSVRQMMSKLSRRNGVLGAVIIKDTWKKAHWMLNPSFKTLDEKRGQVIEHLANGGKRVFQGEQPFDPKEPPLVPMDHPTLPLRRLFLRSILERMGKSAQFSAADIELLKSELPHLKEEAKN
jgi:hypothetical protein